MSLVENRPFSSPLEGADRLHRILRSQKIPFGRFTDTFKEIFKSGLDATFATYNPSAAFVNPPDLYRAVRVDSSDGVTKSILFKYKDEGLEPYLERTFDLEDPFASNIDGEIVFGGVEVNKSFDNKGRIVSHWRTILFRGKTILELRPFFTGPEQMKDIRLIKRPDGKIGVYTRPRNPGNEALGGDGQIGYREFESLDALERSSSSELEIQNSPLVSFRFPKGHWGGVNHAQVLKEGKYQNWNLLTIHHAYKTPDDSLDYSAGLLLHNNETGEIEDLNTWITRDMLPQGPAKSKRERRVVFPSDTIIAKRKLIWWVGASDAETHQIETPKPLALAA